MTAALLRLVKARGILEGAIVATANLLVLAGVVDVAPEVVSAANLAVGLWLVLIATVLTGQGLDQIDQAVNAEVDRRLAPTRAILERVALSVAQDEAEPDADDADDPVDEWEPRWESDAARFGRPPSVLADDERHSNSTIPPGAPIARRP